jgi:hydroxypyruvate reductase/glycerate 2-kinase
MATARPEDVGVCLISGGGSALLPAPVEGVTLGDKQSLTRQLHASGAVIQELNAVRKHLSLIKGGRLAQQFQGRQMLSLIISDVIGDPLDVIASGPTVADPTTFADALGVLNRYGLLGCVPQSVRNHLEAGVRGDIGETPKVTPRNVVNRVIGNNAVALSAAQSKAESLGYRVINLGSEIDGDTTIAAVAQADQACELLTSTSDVAPFCILSGGETTVTLGENHGLGGRNQEFVLAALNRLGAERMKRMSVLSGGSDGEDGPTDAAGAVADGETLPSAIRSGLNPNDFLARHDAYHFFSATDSLIKTGLTQTNVMDVRVILVR